MQLFNYPYRALAKNVSTTDKHINTEVAMFENEIFYLGPQYNK